MATILGLVPANATPGKQIQLLTTENQKAFLSNLVCGFSY